MLVRIANREDPDQTASSEAVTIWLVLFWQTTSVRNFRTFIVIRFGTQGVDLTAAMNYDQVLFPSTHLISCYPTLIYCDISYKQCFLTA